MFNVCCRNAYSCKGILSVDLFAFSKNLSKAIPLFNDNMALMQIYEMSLQQVFISQFVNYWSTISINKQADDMTWHAGIGSFN